MENNLLKTHTTLLSHGHFGWEIKTYDDVTEIAYLEWDDNKKETKRETLSIPSMYDLDVLEEAVRMIKRHKVTP